MLLAYYTPPHTADDARKAIDKRLTELRKAPDDRS
jgi:hypothetical protein